MLYLIKKKKQNYFSYLNFRYLKGIIKFFLFTFIIIVHPYPSNASNYVQFNSIAGNILDFNVIFEGGNDHTFWACGAGDRGSCGGSYKTHYKEILDYLKILSKKKKINIDIYQELQSLSKVRTKIIYNFIEVLNNNIEEVEKNEKKFEEKCSEFRELFTTEYSNCLDYDSVSNEISKNIESPITLLNDIALKNELSSENNEKMKQQNNYTKSLFRDYLEFLKHSFELMENEIFKEEKRLKLIAEAENKKRAEEQYAEKIKNNFKKRSKLFNIQLLSNPLNYQVNNKKVLEKNFAGGFYFENDTYDYFKRNYNVEINDYIYDIIPPTINKSFYSYQIITKEFNENKIITDIYAKAKLINKGIDGCDEFLGPMGNALKEKYGYEIGKEFDALNNKGLKVQIILITDCLVGNEFSYDAYEQLLNADTLHLRLKVNLSEDQILKLFSIDQKNKNKVDTDNF